MASRAETRPSTANAVSKEEWERMKSQIADQLDNVTSNLDELRANGSLETIAQMITRGDKCPTARLQAWYHGMLEVEYLNRPYSVSQKLQHMYRTHSAIGSDDTPQSFILDTNLTSTSSSNDEWKRRSGRPLESAESVVARLERKRPSLSVVERQELWLSKKNLKAAKTQSIIAEAKERAMTAPDLSRSRQSFKPSTQENTVAVNADASTKRRPSTVARKISIADNGPNASKRRPSIVARKRPITATADLNASTKRRSSVVARSRSITATADLNASTKRRSSTVARKRSITAAEPGIKGSLGNITNQPDETKPRKRTKMAPISDPFTQKC